VSADKDLSIHYRSLVVERTTALLNLWLHPKFQLSIVPSNYRLGPTEIRVLWFLGSRGSSTSTELAEASGAGAPSISKAVAKLDVAGLVERRPDGADRRSHTLHLTVEGRTAAQQVYDVGDAMAAEIFASWDEADVLAFSGLLDRFVTDAEVFARRVAGRSDETTKAPPGGRAFVEDGGTGGTVP
jgi:DNA-binding MarR family transcriptional regulator